MMQLSLLIHYTFANFKRHLISILLCIQKYEQMTLNGALAVTFAMLNCRTTTIIIIIN